MKSANWLINEFRRLFSTQNQKLIFTETHQSIHSWVRLANRKCFFSDVSVPCYQRKRHKVIPLAVLNFFWQSSSWLKKSGTKKLDFYWCWISYRTTKRKRTPMDGNFSSTQQQKWIKNYKLTKTDLRLVFVRWRSSSGLDRWREWKKLK